MKFKAATIPAEFSSRIPGKEENVLQIYKCSFTHNKKEFASS